jgi:hypothetical protein
MSIRIMEEGPYLVAPIERWGNKFGSARAKDLIGSRTVRDPYAQFADDPLVAEKEIGFVLHGTIWSYGGCPFPAVESIQRS